MTKPLFVCLNAVSTDDDSKPNQDLNIDSPPGDEPCCHGCGRPISQLKPFGGTVPGFGDLIDCKLAWNSRERVYSPPQKVLEAIETSREDIPRSANMSYEEWYPLLLVRIAEKLACTKEEVEGYLFLEDWSSIVDDYLECRDCIRLSTKRFQRMETSKSLLRYNPIRCPEAMLGSWMREISRKR